MTSSYQALTGLSEITTDDLIIDGTLTTPKFTMPTGAANGYVLTSDAIGSASWQALIQTLLGDVIGPFQSNTVQTVGGSTAANIHSAELLANASTNVNTFGTIVKRDASGNFNAATITAFLAGSISGTSSGFTGTLVGDVTGTQGATAVTTINGQAANQTVTLTGVQSLSNKTISGTFTGNLTGNATTASSVTMLGDCISSSSESAARAIHAIPS